jgi:hypothetical protein
MGASLAMIDRRYGHLARNCGDQACALSDAHAADSAACTFVQVDTPQNPETRMGHALDVSPVCSARRL